MLYTLLPVIVYSYTDRDVSDELSLQLPQLYHLGVRKAYMNVHVVLKWLFEAIFESLIIFFFIIPAMCAAPFLTPASTPPESFRSVSSSSSPPRAQLMRALAPDDGT